MNQGIKELFQFTKNQTRAIIILCLLTLCALAIRLFFAYFFTPKKVAESDPWLQEAMTQIYIDSNRFTTKEPISILRPFNFDPNTITEAAFLKMGMRPKMVKTILNYRSKGGRFYKKEDVKKMYGLHEKEYEQLAPFISIPTNKYARTYSSPKYNTNLVNNTKVVVSINTADAATFALLYGIGDKLASNIIKYRSLLGGFTNVDQLKEVYGISPETFSAIKKQLICRPSEIKKININEATYNEMKAHPYLRENDWALAITKFRKSQDYHIKNVEDLRQLEGMTQQTFNKIAPYLRIE